MKAVKRHGSNMNKKRILLTGGFGYIGSTFIERYFNKYSITALDVNFFGYPKKLKSKTTNTIIKDIRDISITDLKDIDIPFGFKINAFKEIPFGWKPDATNPNEILGKDTDITTEKFLNISQQLIDLGSKIIGGCCEITPKHISKLKNLKF